MARNRNDHRPAPENEFTRLVKRIQPTGLLRDQRFARLLNLLNVDPDDAEIRELVSDRLQEAEMRQLLSPDPFRPTNPISQADFDGSIILGRISPNDVIWQIRPSQLTNHCLLIGKSGGGKTNMILLILAQVLENHAH